MNFTHFLVQLKNLRVFLLLLLLIAGCNPQSDDLDLARTQVAEDIFSQQTQDAQNQLEEKPTPTPEEIYTPPPTPNPARIVQDGFTRLEGAGFQIWAPENYSSATGEELENWLSANQSALDPNFHEKLLYFEPDPAEFYLAAFQTVEDQVRTILTVRPYQIPSGLSSQDFLEGILTRLPADVEISNQKIFSYRGDLFPQTHVHWLNENIQQVLAVREYEEQQYLLIFTSTPGSPAPDPQNTGTIIGSFMRDAPLTQPPIVIGEKTVSWEWITGENLQVLVPSRFFGSKPGEQLANLLKDFPSDVAKRADRVQSHPAGIDLWAFEPSSEIELMVGSFIPAAPEPLDETMEDYLDSRTEDHAELLMSELKLTSLEGNKEIIREVFQDPTGITVRYYKPRKGLIGGVNAQPGFNMHCFLTAENLDAWLPILDEIALSWNVVSED